jgi:hypothetical protein
MCAPEGLPVKAIIRAGIIGMGPAMRTSENAVRAKFAEYPYYEVR